MTQQELERAIQEVWTLFKETDERIEKLSREMDRKFKETDQKMEELSRKIDREILKEVSRSARAFSGKQRWLVDGLIVPGAFTLFRERGIEVNRIFQRVKSHKGKGIEIDIVAVGREHAVLIEARSTLSVDDVKEHVERMKAFKRFVPEYADRKAVGAVAGIVIEKGADFAYWQGFFVIAQTGETVAILNDEKFQPRAW